MSVDVSQASSSLDKHSEKVEKASKANDKLKESSKKAKESLEELHEETRNTSDLIKHIEVTEKEAQAHEKNAKAIEKETKAKQKLNKVNNETSGTIPFQIPPKFDPSNFDSKKWLEKATQKEIEELYNQYNFQDSPQKKELARKGHYVYPVTGAGNTKLEYIIPHQKKYKNYESEIANIFSIADKLGYSNFFTGTRLRDDLTLQEYALAYLRDSENFLDSTENDIAQWVNDKTYVGKYKNRIKLKYEDKDDYGNPLGTYSEKKSDVLNERGKKLIEDVFATIQDIKSNSKISINNQDYLLNSFKPIDENDIKISYNAKNYIEKKARQEEVQDYNKKILAYKDRIEKSIKNSIRDFYFTDFFGKEYGSKRDELIDIISTNLSMSNAQLKKVGDKVGTEFLKDLGFTGERTKENLTKFFKNDDVMFEKNVMPLLLDDDMYNYMLSLKGYDKESRDTFTMLHKLKQLRIFNKSPRYKDINGKSKTLSGTFDDVLEEGWENPLNLVPKTMLENVSNIKNKIMLNDTKYVNKGLIKYYQDENNSFLEHAQKEIDREITKELENLKTRLKKLAFNNNDRYKLKDFDKQETPIQVEEIAQKTSTKVKKGIKKIEENIKNEIPNTAQEVQENLSEVGTQVSSSLKKGVKDIGDKVEESSEEIKTTFRDVTNTIENAFASVGSSFRQTFHSYGKFIRNLSSTIYAVQKMSSALYQTMSGVEFLNAQGFRLERYDTTGYSKEQMINNLYKVSQNSRGNLEGVATLTQRLLATGVTNGSSSEALRLASIISKASFIGGSTAQESKSAIMQLSQGIASNQLGGDELRSIRENAIGITEMLSKGLTKAYEKSILTDDAFKNVSIGDLKELGKKGKLTADVVIKAFDVMEDEVNEAFSKMPQTFSQTLDKLNNTFMKKMYDLSGNGKGFARITSWVEKLEKYLNSTEGEKVMNTLINIIDTVIDKFLIIAKFFSGAISLLGNKLTFVANIGTMVGASKFISSLFLGSRFFDRKSGEFISTSGLIGAGGFIHTLWGIMDIIKGNKRRPIKEIVGKSFDRFLGERNEDGEIINTGFIGGIFESVKLVTKFIKGGKLAPIITKITSILSTIAGPLAIIAGVIAGWKYLDKKAEDKDWENFKKSLPSLDIFSKLTEEDKSSLLEQAREKYNANYNKWGKFIGGTLDGKWAERIRDEYRDDAFFKNEEYLKKIQEGVNNIDSNTAGTLDITDEFIRNMRDIQTRSFRGQLLMGGNRNITGSWNVTIRNESDLQNISKQVEIALNEGVTNWANGNLNQVPV